MKLIKEFSVFKKELMSTGIFKEVYQTTAGCYRFSFCNVINLELRAITYSTYPDETLMIDFEYLCPERFRFISLSLEEVLKKVDRETAKKLIFNLDLFISDDISP